VPFALVCVDIVSPSSSTETKYLTLVIPAMPSAPDVTVSAAKNVRYTVNPRRPRC
jgi:hypothetical protein